jgi:hypothetical protein
VIQQGKVYFLRTLCPPELPPPGGVNISGAGQRLSPDVEV